MTLRKCLFSTIIILIFLNVLKASAITSNTLNLPSIVSCNAPNLYDIGISADQSCIEHDNHTRCWYTFIPDSLKNNFTDVSFMFQENNFSSFQESNSTLFQENNSTSVPIVFDLHGYTGCASWTTYYSGWAKLAEEKEFILILPQGNMDKDLSDFTCWTAGDECESCCTQFNPVSNDVVYTNTNDISFLRQIVANTVENVEDVPIDTRRIYFAGHANGCSMSQTMAAQASDLVAAVCCHSGTLVNEVSDDYQPTPIHIVFGNADNAYPFDGVNERFPLNAIQSYEYWGSQNGCSVNTTTIDNSSLYSTHEFSSCKNGANVRLLEVFNVGHAPYLLDNNTDKTLFCFGLECASIDTTSLSWDFCSSFQSISEPSIGSAVPYVAPDTFENLAPPFIPVDTETSTDSENTETPVENTETSGNNENNETSTNAENIDTPVSVEKADIPTPNESTDTSSSFRFFLSSNLVYILASMYIVFSL